MILTLKKLKCITTEDYTGSDDCRLVVKVDPVRVDNPYLPDELEQLGPDVFQYKETFVLKKRLNDGDSWTVNRDIEFNDKVIIKLYDEDDYDDNDFLGSAIIDRSTIDTAFTFDKDDADYQLSIEIKDGNIEDSLTNLIEAFKKSTRKGKWKHIDKQKLIDGIIKRVFPNEEEGRFVNQGKSSLCGPASVIYELIERDRGQYIKACRKLFEKGKYKSIIPSDDLLRAHIPKSIVNGQLVEIGSADWILLSSMRDSRNLILDLEGYDSTNSRVELLSSISLPTDIKYWLELFNLAYRTEYTSTAIYGEASAMEEAKNCVDNGGIAIILVDSAILKDVDYDSTNFYLSNHYITYIDNYSFRSNRVKYKCYSWGKEMDIDVNEAKFEDCTFGAVYGYI